MVTVRSTVMAIEQQVSCDLAGEAAILDLRHGTYYGLNAVGASVWQLLQQPKTVHDIHTAILAEYDVTPQQCEHDLLVLLEQLRSANLIEVTDAAA